MRKRLLFVLPVLLLGATALSAQMPPVDSRSLPALPSVATPAPSSDRAPTACPPTQKDCSPQFWASADYLLWWVKKAPLPPVATTGPFNPDTFTPGVDPSPGAIGSPNTTILRGGRGVDLGTFSGVQLRTGYWLTPDRSVGVEAGAFLLERRSASFTATSDANGVPLLKVPFFDTSSGQEIGANAAFANDTANTFGGLAGSIRVVNTLRLWGADLATAVNLHDTKTLRVDLLVGLRYLDLDESARIAQTSSPIGQPLFAGFLGNDVPLGASITSLDNFHTRNKFYGGTVGGRVYWQVMDQLELSLLGRLGLGVTQERSAVGGLSTLVMPGVPTMTAQGGTLALPSNIGVRRGSDFAVVPEVNLNAHYQLTSYLTASVGYSFLYWSSVVRPGDQIDHNVDSRQIPTGQTFVQGLNATSPSSLMKRTDFWANGVNFGLEFQF